jgi:hypothetical protein
MNKLLVLFFCIFLSAGCSKDDSNPVDPTNNVTGFMLAQVNFASWSAEELEAARLQNTLNIKGTKTILNNPVYNSSELLIRIININQPGTFGIGENESGIQYFIKGTYTLKSNDGSQTEVFTAYYLDYSLMKINSITDDSIEAEFDMKLYNQDFTDSLFITGGRMNIDF